MNPLLVRSLQALALSSALALVGACALVDPIEDGYELAPPAGGFGGESSVGGGGGLGGFGAGGMGGVGAGGQPAGGGGMGVVMTTTFGERPLADVQGVTFDTQLHFQNTNLNYGSNLTFWADNDTTEGRVGLLRFDLSSIQGSTVPEDAVLSIWVQDFTDTESVGTVSIYPLLEAWTEGNLNGQPGVCNWIQRTASDGWTTPGAAPPSRGITRLGLLMPSVQDTEHQLPVPADLVQGWVDDPSSNHGMVFVNNSNDGAGFRSSNSGDLDRRPLLTVSYIEP